MTAAKKFVTLYHPSIEGVEQTVAASSVDDWTEQGWRKTNWARAVQESDSKKQAAQDAAAAKVLADANVPVTIVTEA